jgi:hypothetical protein
MFTNTREDAKPRRRGIGCLLRSLVTLIVLLVLIAGGLFFGVRPLVLSKLDTVLTSAVDNIPPPIAQLPAGPVQLSEQLLNNLLVLQSSPDDIVKNPHISITSSAVRMGFNVFGFDCAVSGVPQLQNGQLVMTNTNIEGIVALILTPDDITTLVNNHLVDAQKKINHPIESVQLKNQEVDMVLGPPNGGGLPPPP